MSEELLHWVKCHTAYGKGVDIFEKDCDIVEFLLDHCEIYFPEGTRFLVKVDCFGIRSHAVDMRMQKFSHLMADAGLAEGIDAFAYTGTYDFGHTCAGWEDVITLGIYGLRNRIAQYLYQSNADGEKVCFYKNLLRVYDAALRFMKRVSDQAFQCGKREMADALLHLCTAQPADLYEALQTSVIYYVLQQYFDGTFLRTLGRLDKLFYPLYAKENKDRADRLLLDYMKDIDQFEAIANIPFAIGGTDPEAKDLTNELSYALLDMYHKAETTNTKLHILCSANMPQDIVKKAFQCIWDGNNSIVFMSDAKVIEALKKQGAEHKDAVNYHVVGCYECGAEEELTCSCNARVNIPKALELALNGGKDMLTGKQIGLAHDGKFETFEALRQEFERQLSYLCKCAMTATDLCESHYPEIYSAPILSGTYMSALEKGEDLYLGYAAKYNNSSLNALGLATATDALAAIQKAVFEDQVVSLAEFVAILKANWNEKEYLRLLIKNRYPKYGQGDIKTDEIATRIVDVLSDAVSYKPNAKGGIWRLGLFSINWRWDFGEKTAASADGRLCGETLSQNISASFGADKEGATAHLLSAARLDASKIPNGAIVDIDLHSSAVRGNNGIEALATSLKTFFALGGFAVHYNVLDTAVLEDARKNPDKYPNLQVRLCGWNVLFSSLSDREKEEFIMRSMG